MEAVEKINQLARNVMWRRRLLALQDALVLGIIIAGFLSAAVVVYLRWQLLNTPIWLIVAAIFTAVSIGLLIKWRLAFKDENDAGFLIDESLSLEDRFATAQAIINRGNPYHQFEAAQIKDAAGKIAETQASTIIPYQLKKFYAMSLISSLVLVVAFLIPQKSLPGGQEIAEMREEITLAGEELEKYSTEIEKFTPPDTVTAQLAKEQAALGRELRNSNYDRADALKKLGTLEEKIRQRHDELNSTRANEIVGMAERRMRSVLANIGKEEKASDNNQTAIQGNEIKEAQSTVPEKSGAKSAKVQPKSAESKAVATKPNTAEPKAKSTETKSTTKDKQTQVAQTPGVDKSKKEATAKPETQPNESTEKGDDSQVAKTENPESRKSTEGQKPQPESPEKNREPSSEDQPGKTEAVDKELAQTLKEVEKETRSTPNESPNSDPQKSDGANENSESTNPITSTLTEQGTKALSNELMDKAKDLQNGKLSAEDIAKLGQSAAQLAKDLAPLAQSKEFQNALEQMVKQINPQTIEQVARELQKNEQLRKELQAAAKLLLQNQQVKEMIAGFRKMGEEMARERGLDEKLKEQEIRKQQAEQQSEQITLNAKNEPGKPGKNNPTGGKGIQTPSTDSSRKLEGKGREERFAGKLQERPQGDFVYTNNQAGKGSARVSYSNAYPQYRREAERSVQRSQVPTQMRSLVRNYFDAINPDARKSN
ncbi:MAG: hypothetical protein AB1757_22730 [Acidobacteriota bacterium]